MYGHVKIDDYSIVYFDGSCRCRVKVALRHTCVALHMRSVVWHLHDVCAIHVRLNSVHDCSKLVVVYWLGLSVQVRVKVRARDRKWIFFSVLKSDEHLCLAFPGLA